MTDINAIATNLGVLKKSSPKSRPTLTKVERERTTVKTPMEKRHVQLELFDASRRNPDFKREPEISASSGTASRRNPVSSPLIASSRSS